MNQRPPERLSTAAPAWCRARPWWPMVSSLAPSLVPRGRPWVIVTDAQVPRLEDQDAAKPWPKVLLFGGLVEVRVGFGGRGDRWMVTVSGGRG